MKNITTSLLDSLKVNLINSISWFQEIPENEGIIPHLKLAWFVTLSNSIFQTWILYFPLLINPILIFHNPVKHSNLSIKKRSTSQCHQQLCISNKLHRKDQLSF